MIILVIEKERKEITKMKDLLLLVLLKKITTPDERKEIKELIEKIIAWCLVGVISVALGFGITWLIIAKG